MLSRYFWLALWLCVVLNWRCIDARVRGGSSTDQEHVHIKVLMPEVLRKQTHHKIHRHPGPRPHYAKRLPTRPASKPITHTIYSPYDFELLTQLQQQQHPPPIPLLDTEQESMPNFGPALFDNDIITGTRTHRQQPQIHLPAMLPPPPLQKPMSQSIYATSPDAFSSTLFDMNDTGSNVLSADDFLRDLQQLYASKFAVTPPVVMQSPQPLAERLRQIKKPAHKKRKTQHYNNKPYYNNHYSINNNNNYAKKQQYSFMEAPTSEGGEQDLSDELNNLDDEDVEQDSGETDSINADNDNMAMAFNAPIQWDDSTSIEDNAQQSGSLIGGFSPVSYQDLYATYAATPATNQLSTLPTRPKYKRHQYPRLPATKLLPQQQQQLEEQFVPLSSLVPFAVNSGLAVGHDTVRSTVRAPTTRTTLHSTEEQHNQQRNKKRKNRIKPKRNRVMVQEKSLY